MNIFDKDNQLIVWKEDTQILACDKCEKDLPNTVLNCPYCGTHFNVG